MGIESEGRGKWRQPSNRLFTLQCRAGQMHDERRVRATVAFQVRGQRVEPWIGERPWEDDPFVLCRSAQFAVKWHGVGRYRAHFEKSEAKSRQPGWCSIIRID